MSWGAHMPWNMRLSWMMRLYLRIIFQRIPPSMVEEVRQHVQEMQDPRTIQLSTSPCCSSIILVRKKDGSLCFCIDFRHLNKRTLKDGFPLPWIEEMVENMTRAQHFSCLDLKSGFWQVKMSPESKKYMAFTVGNLGYSECECMPFGLCNTPAMFEQHMQNCYLDIYIFI